jgi:aminoglycoside adenylyltransferase-like protein/nucleotidyltransferase-like protein
MTQSDPEASYLSLVASCLQGLLGRNLVGVYAGGSYALGDYRRESSDLDLAAVVSSPLSSELKQQIVERLRHESLPCPARALELVIYRWETARSGSVKADFVLNLNTGSELPLRVECRARAGEGHWFPIDRSMLAQAGIALLGPPASKAFSPISPEALAPILVDSLRWHRANPEHQGDAVLNSCRSMRFVTEGRWSSKPAAGRWAVERGLAPKELVERAFAIRRAPVADPARRAADTAAPAPYLAEVEEFVAKVESRLSACLRVAGPSRPCRRGPRCA